jgi:hypothetical protein
MHRHPLPGDKTNGTTGWTMADKNGLGLLGVFFGGVTVAVTIIAFMVVRDHVEGRMALDEMAMTPQLVSTRSN